MYICRICKSGGGGRASSASLPIQGNSSSSPSRYNEDSNDNWSLDDISPSSSGAAAAAAAAAAGTYAGDYESSGRMGLGKGKPMLGGKRGRRGFGYVGRPRGMYSPLGAGSSGGWKGGSPTKPGSVGIGSKKRGDMRRRGRQPKIRGMVGLQVRRNRN